VPNRGADLDWRPPLGRFHLTPNRRARHAPTSKPVLYRRWRNRAELAVAALRQERPMLSAEPSDTDSLRGDVLALLRRTYAGLGEIGLDTRHRPHAPSARSRSREPSRSPAAWTWGIPASGPLLQVLKSMESLSQLGDLDPLQVALRQHAALAAGIDCLIDELLANVIADGVKDGASWGRDPEAFEPSKVVVVENAFVDLEPCGHRPPGSMPDVHGHVNPRRIDVAQLVKIEGRVMRQGSRGPKPKQRLLVLRQRIPGQLRDQVDRERDAFDDAVVCEAPQCVLGRPDCAGVVGRQQPMLIDSALKESWKELCRHGNTVRHLTRFCQVRHT